MVFHPDFVEDFVEYQHPIQDKSASYEGGLVRMGNRVVGWVLSPQPTWGSPLVIRASLWQIFAHGDPYATPG